MRLKLKHITLSLSLLALAACKESVGVLDPVEPTIPDSEKTPIELSVGGLDAPAMTRAVVTNGDNKTLNPFDTNTKIFMVMKSEYGQDDYQGSRDVKYTVARGDVLVSENDNTNHRSIVKFDATNQRYWDDAHARSSQLDIWAYAQKGQSWTNCTFEVPNSGSGIDAYKDKTYDTSTAPNPVWSKGAEGEIYPAIRRWRASHYVDDTKSNYRCQDKTTVMCQDLLFSNNLTNNKLYNGNEYDDNRLKFNFETRKFPQVGNANMIFYHAMSKITIHIKKGDGFTDADPFAFTTGNVKLMGFNTEGLFNIKTGQFEYIHEHYDIPQIYKWETAADGDAYTLEALVIPNVNGNAMGLTDSNSRLVDNSNSKSMEFVIDGNKFEISQDHLYEALKAKSENSSIVSDGRVNLEAGKNYVFTFVVGKTKIKNITAQVAEWENVQSEDILPSNARIELNLEERGTTLTSSDKFSLYRAADDNTGEINDNYTNYKWQTGYKGNGNVTTPTYVDENGSVPAHWTTNWYWENNKNFYHFRVLAKINGTQKEAYTPTINTETQSEVDYDYITLSHKEKSYDDILWGAPMLDVEEGTNENGASDSKPLLWLYGPTKNGFDADDNNKVAENLPSSTTHQIYKAIGPTEDQIKLILFHMMSDVTFKFYTSSGVDRVHLGTGSGTDVTTIELKNIHTEGKLYMGNGLVIGSDAVSDFTFTQTPAPDASGYLKWAGYGAIPQDLANVQLVITTPDHNQYIVDLAEVVTTGITPKNLANPYKVIPEGEKNAGKYKLDRWYPGFKYNYTFKLTKKGITDVKATIVEWETVEAEQDPVQIR